MSAIYYRAILSALQHCQRAGHRYKNMFFSHLVEFIIYGVFYISFSLL